MRFGPKLDDLPEVPPGGQIIATMELFAPGPEFKHEVTLYLEEPGGTGSLNITVKAIP